MINISIEEFMKIKTYSFYYDLIGRYINCKFMFARKNEMN